MTLKRWPAASEVKNSSPRGIDIVANFKVGDYVVFKNGDCFFADKRIGNTVFLVTGIEPRDDFGRAMVHIRGGSGWFDFRFRLATELEVIEARLTGSIPA